jgi:hypothetical protein
MLCKALDKVQWHRYALVLFYSVPGRKGAGAERGFRFAETPILRRSKWITQDIR